MKMLDINTLISSDESEALDFKIVFHEHNIKLIHDILCLANANTRGDRYLVFGVSGDRTIHGIQNDPNLKDNAMIQDLLRASKFNRIPTVRLEKLAIEGKKLAVLRIKNRPDKPFFLTTDLVEGNERIRAGVIYTRLGDTNIPLCEAAPEDHVELMWRERFGLGLHPLARLEQLVQENTKWVQVQGESDLYHRDFPEFTICHGKELNPRFSMAWTKTFPIRMPGVTKLKSSFLPQFFIKYRSFHVMEVAIMYRFLSLTRRATHGEFAWALWNTE